MPKSINKQEILKRNPHIKQSQLDNSIALSQQLMESGIQVAGYNLASPFSRRRIRKLRGEFDCTKHTRGYRSKLGALPNLPQRNSPL